MKKQVLPLLMSLVCIISLSGCVTTLGENGEIHDELFTYDMPYDRAYLRVLDVIELIPAWDVENTAMKEGLIVAREDGPDGGQLIFKLRSVNKKQVTLELAKMSQRERGAGKLLQQIDSMMLSTGK